MHRAIKITVLVIALLGGLAFCFYEGILQCNYPSRDKFPVWGVDVSHHQGVINWPVLAGEGIRFVYMKATEGGDFKDRRFTDNWREAKEAGLAVGAYHFFLPGKTGREQAENFIASVPVETDSLPPVLDVECPVPPSAPEREAIRVRIRECLALMAERYGKTPVIYATYEAYDAFIQGEFADNPLWIRSVFTSPDRKALGRDWVFWQYSERVRLPGYAGPERFIDCNVFNGTNTAFGRFRLGKR